MPLSSNLKALAEDEVRLWSVQVGSKLIMPGQQSELTAETLYRRMIVKYPYEMDGYTLDDLKRSVFEDGDYFNDNWFRSSMPPNAIPTADEPYSDEPEQ